MVKPLYVLDANVFIESSKKHYAFDIAPTFWKGISNHAKSGLIVSIDRVYNEIARGKDQLFDWLKKNMESSFVSTDNENTVGVFTEMMVWVSASNHYKDSAKSEFAQVADGWIIAYAKANGITVVSDEKYNKDKKSKVPIPNICEEFKIPCIHTFELMRKLKITL